MSTIEAICFTLNLATVLVVLVAEIWQIGKLNRMDAKLNELYSRIDRCLSSTLLCGEKTIDKGNEILEAIENLEVEFDEEVEVECPCRERGEDCEYCVVCDECRPDCAYESCEEDCVHLISHTQFKFDHTYSHNYVLHYNEHTDTLACEGYPETGYAIDNVGEVIGDALRYFGVRSDSPNRVYVRNHKYKCDFMIEKVGATE